MSAEFSRVLIAETDPSLRLHLSSALLGFDVFSDTVSTTSDALAKLGEEEYGVVVIDVALPFGDVERVIDAIAQMTVATRPVVLVLAANPEAAKSLDVEIVQIVLRKPVNLPQLVDVVRSCTRNSRSRTIAEDPPEKPNGDHMVS